MYCNDGINQLTFDDFIVNGTESILDMEDDLMKNSSSSDGNSFPSNTLTLGQIRKMILEGAKQNQVTRFFDKKDFSNIDFRRIILTIF